MTDKPWKLVLLLTGIFLAGAVTGGFVTVRVARNWAQRAAQPEQWGPKRLKMLAKKLELTPEQIEKLQPIIKRDMEDLNRVRQTGFREARRILERMESDVAAELTSEQKVKFEQLNKELRERMQHFSHEHQGPGGMHDRLPPPPPGAEAPKDRPADSPAAKPADKPPGG
jgi:Spy/CpxP family protein refolding chaperone